MCMQTRVRLTPTGYRTSIATAEVAFAVARCGTACAASLSSHGRCKEPHSHWCMGCQCASAEGTGKDANTAA